MAESIIFANEFLRIFLNAGSIYIETFKRGLPIEQLSTILAQHPEIGVTSMNALLNAINFAPRPPEKFAELREKMTANVSDDCLNATITFNMPKEALDPSNRERLKKEALAFLNEKGIVFGIKNELFDGEIINSRQYTVAEGIAPVNGQDSVVRTYQLLDAKPEVREDGSVDFYELKLINKVSTGDWLGERIEATRGTPGRSVKGALIEPIKGTTYQLNFDKNTVQEVSDSNKTTLYSKTNGAVSYLNGRISVSNHLEIDGDVGIGTGNIKFDGLLTIKGTVCDGFSVEATKDIEIKGEMGLGNVKSIISTDGNIYIKGGLSAKNRVEIKAAKNIFIKFVDNANITSNGSIHIGYYCLNSNLTAKEIVMDSSNARLIGGYIKAEIKVTSPIIGTEKEKKTIVEVTGFNRHDMLQNLDNLFRKISELKNEQQKLKMFISTNDAAKQLDNLKRKEYNIANDRLYLIRNEIKSLEEERKSIAGYLKTHGEGEIAVTGKIYPNCTLILNKTTVEISTILHAPTFFMQDGAIKQI
jgi:Predicted polymerase, most proteins contain PALM domain, HD hydrolase domain and Zn-ribbon domain